MGKIQIDVSGDTAQWLARMVEHSGWTLAEVVAEVFRCAQEADQVALLVQSAPPIANVDIEVEEDREPEPIELGPGYVLPW